MYTGGVQVLQSLCTNGNENQSQSILRTRSSTAITGLCKFIKSARTKIFEPLLRDENLAPMRPAVSVCLSLLESGWLCSVEVIERHTMAVAKVVSGLLSAERNLGNFISQLLRCSSTIIRDNNPNLTLDYELEFISGRRNLPTKVFGTSNECSSNENNHLFVPLTSKYDDSSSGSSPTTGWLVLPPHKVHHITNFIH